MGERRIARMVAQFLIGVLVVVAVAEVWSGASQISQIAYGSNANPVLDSAFDFPVRYATVGVVAGWQLLWCGRCWSRSSSRNTD